MFKVFCISYVSCQSFVDTDFLLFLKDLKHLSMSSSWTPRYLRKVSWIYFFCLQMDFDPAVFFLASSSFCLPFSVAHGVSDRSHYRPR